jgi:hypothetical protein
MAGRTSIKSKFRQAPGRFTPGHGVRSVGKLCGDTPSVSRIPSGARHSANPARPRRRGNRVGLAFAAVHESESGTSRHFAALEKLVVIRASRTSSKPLDSSSISEIPPRTVRNPLCFDSDLARLPGSGVAGLVAHQAPVSEHEFTGQDFRIRSGPSRRDPASARNRCDPAWEAAGRPTRQRVTLPIFEPGRESR